MMQPSKARAPRRVRLVRAPRPTHTALPARLEQWRLTTHTPGGVIGAPFRLARRSDWRAVQLGAGWTADRLADVVTHPRYCAIGRAFRRALQTTNGLDALSLVYGTQSQHI